MCYLFMIKTIQKSYHHCHYYQNPVTVSQSYDETDRVAPFSLAHPVCQVGCVVLLAHA